MRGPELGPLLLVGYPLSAAVPMAWPSALSSHFLCPRDLAIRFTYGSDLVIPPAVTASYNKSDTYYGG
jgi:hypothetical protein